MFRKIYVPVDNSALAEPANFLGIGFDHGLADRDLAVAADYHLAALADRQNRGAVPDRQGAPTLFGDNVYCKE